MALATKVLLVRLWDSSTHTILRDRQRWVELRTSWLHASSGPFGGVPLCTGVLTSPYKRWAEAWCVWISKGDPEEFCDTF